MKSTKNKIGTCLWFDDQAAAAAKFYVSLFENAKITKSTEYTKESAGMSGKKEGDAMTVGFQLENMNFMGLNGGPQFQINPSISFFINCETEAEVDRFWGKLSEGGKVMMPLDKYDYSDKYGWVQDKFGVSWQVILSKPEGGWRPKIIPCLLFTGEKSGKTKPAIDFYTEIFENSEIGLIAPNDKPGQEGKTAFADFALENMWIAAMDSPQDDGFGFNEAISFVVNCQNQEEIDYYWEKFTADGEESMCGWLKDEFGVSWQIVPENISELIKPKKAMEAMLLMKKLDIEKLKNVQ